MIPVLVIIIIALLIVIFLQSFLYNSPNVKWKSVNIKYHKFSPTKQEIEEVKKQIREKGYWNLLYEWKSSTDTYCEIKPEIKNGKTMYLTTVRCEHTTTFYASSIERAILFKKIYEHLQVELYDNLGWSGWKDKNNYE